MIRGATINISWKRSHCVNQELHNNILLYYTIQLHIINILQCSPVLFHEEAARSKVGFSLWPGLRHVLSTRQSGNCQEPNGTRKRGLSIERAS